jgi:peptidoglycan/xylan/chitin deacetylase (PgdA/CDA1 family)
VRRDGSPSIRSDRGVAGATVPILMYHQVTPSPPPGYRKYAVTTEAFAAQLEWLAQHRYVSISMNALYEHRMGRQELPARPVILTFDDGYRDCLEYAAPILKARGFTATFFVLGLLAGKTSQWLLAERGIELPLLDWDAVRQLRAAGNECGSHGLSHPRLTQLSPSACREELLTSRRLIEDQLGEEVGHLAYPFGAYDESVRAIAVESGYRTACSVRPGWSPPGDDLMALRRIHVEGEGSMRDFADSLRRRRTPAELVRAGVRALRRRWGAA